MTGNNKLVLNEATVMEALQLWLDSKTLTQMAEVTGVSYLSNDYTFVVRLGEPKGDK